MSPKAIRHRLETGRLHELHRGVYAVGRPDASRRGQMMAAVPACGSEARLSHQSGADLWRIRAQRGGPIHVALPSQLSRRHRGIRQHRRTRLEPPRYVDRISVDPPVSILIDLATSLSTEQVEDAVNEADRLKLLPTPRLRLALDAELRRPGVGRLRRILDAQTFSKAQNKLERRFLAIARAAGLPQPRTQPYLNSHRVDFHWPELGLVVETDSLTYHRTASEQAVDVRGDQAHVRAGLRTLRFTHLQVFGQPSYVREVLEDTRRHLG
jgi:very-short-patch-repair endonuclease